MSVTKRGVKHISPDEVGYQKIEDPGAFKAVTFRKDVSKQAAKIRKAASEMCLYLNEALVKFGYAGILEISERKIENMSDIELVSECKLVDNYKVMTPLMAEICVELFDCFHKQMWRRAKTILSILKETQAGKTRDAQNFVIMTAACMAALHGVEVLPLIMLTNDHSLENQMKREWPMQRAFWRHMIVYCLKNRHEVLIGDLLTSWDLPDEDGHKNEDGTGFWIMRRSPSKIVAENWLRKIETVKKNNNQHLIIIQDEGDVGPGENGVMDRLMETADLYNYLRNNREKANITLVPVSATILCTHQLIKDIAIQKVLPVDEGYRHQEDAYVGMDDVKNAWGVNLLSLGCTSAAVSNPYVNYIPFVALHCGISQKKATDLTNDEGKIYLEEWETFKNETVPQTLARASRLAIEKGWDDEKLGHMNFNGVAIRYVVKNTACQAITDRLRELLPEFLVVPFFEAHGSRKDVINTIEHARRIENKKDNPVCLIWTSKGRRGNQVPDGFCQFDFTRVASVEASQRQNAGRPGGYKTASLFVCTHKFCQSMTDFKKGRGKLQPSYYSNKSGVIRDSLVMSLQKSQFHRDYPVIDNLFKMVEKHYLNTEANINQAKRRIGQGNAKKLAIQGMTSFWMNVEASCPNIFGDDGIFSPDVIRWIEENQELLFCDHEGPLFQSIKINTTLHRATKDDVGFEYNATGEVEGKERTLFSFRQGEDQNTNLAWCQNEGGKKWVNAVVPQFHYEFDKKKKQFECVAIHLRLQEEPSHAARTVYPKENTVMYKLLSDEERELTDLYWERIKNVG